MPASAATPATADYGDPVMAHAQALSRWSDHPGNLTCTYLTPAHRATARQLEDWMREAGFDSVRQDAVGNIIGRYRADPALAEPVLVATGSHYDTVRNGGKYDGRLGILLPIAVVAELNRRGQRLPFDFEVIGFAEEEGVRYGGSFLGSSAYIGQFDPAQLDKRDADGITMRQAMQDAGLDPAQAASQTADPRLHHYFEVHIEQGPVLHQRALPLGVVTSIAGCVRLRLVLAGAAGHAGTTPMDLRRDAACAAAEIVLAVESRCRQEPGLVGTVGMLHVPDGSINVIPGACHLTLDVRAAHDAERDRALADIDTSIREICARRGIGHESEELMRVPASPCSPPHQALWRQAVAAQGLAVAELPSGAGHDAMLLGRVVPVSMLFVRCGNGGVSHNPQEIMTAGDAQLAGQAVMEFLKLCAPGSAGA